MISLIWHMYYGTTAQHLKIYLKNKLTFNPSFNPRDRACLPEQSLKAYNLAVKRRKNSQK